MLKILRKKQEERKATLVQLFNYILLFMATVGKKEETKKNQKQKKNSL